MCLVQSFQGYEFLKIKYTLPVWRQNKQKREFCRFFYFQMMRDRLPSPATGVLYGVQCRYLFVYILFRRYHRPLWNTLLSYCKF